MDDPYFDYKNKTLRTYGAEGFKAKRAAEEAEEEARRTRGHEKFMVNTDAWKDMISQVEELKREIKRLKKTVS